MKTEKLVRESQKLIAEGKTEINGQRTGVASDFGLLGYLSTFSTVESL